MKAGTVAARLDFRPAFFDFATSTIYLSRHADGRLAATHRPDGLPDAVVTSRSPSGEVLALKGSLVAGFERTGFFFPRPAAARAAAEWA